MTQTTVNPPASPQHPEFTPGALAALRRGYLDKDSQGNPAETPEAMFRRVAVSLSNAELLYGEEPREERRQAVEDEIYDAMRSLEILPDSATLMNAGRELQQLPACHVLPVEDSLESIFNSIRITAVIHKFGGGTGLSLGRLRPEGDPVGTTGGAASGPVGFARAFDTTAGVVEEGNLRQGTNTAVLNADHPDILNFIESQRKDQAPRNSGAAVAATDEFMRNALNWEDYLLVNPRTGRAASSANAKEVLNLIAEAAWDKGNPTLTFIDQVNRSHPNGHLGRIEAACHQGEQPMLPYESCHLAFLNLGRMIRPGVNEIDRKKIAARINTAIRMLDNAIDTNPYPAPEIEAMTKRTRRIGLSVMGLADTLIALGAPYDSEEALEITRELMKFIQAEAHAASGRLAEERGNYPAWSGSSYAKRPEGTAQAMRNTQPVTVAPAGTVGIIAAASNGIEPPSTLAYPPLEQAAAAHGFNTPEIMEQAARTGSLQNTQAPAWAKKLFKTAGDISPHWHLRMQAAAQTYADNAVAKTVNFPAAATRDEIAEACITAWRLGCKGISIRRDGSRERRAPDEGQRGTKSGNEPRSHKPVPRDRPQALTGVTQRFRSGHGNIYVTVNFDEEGRAFEVFGNLGKAGGCDSAQTEAITKLISLALRAGISPETVATQLRGITCCPAWDNGVQIRSTPDALALALTRTPNNANSGQAGRPDPAALRLPGR